MPRLRHTVEQILAKLRKETRKKACGSIRSRCRRGSGGGGAGERAWRACSFLTYPAPHTTIDQNDLKA